MTATPVRPVSSMIAKVLAGLVLLAAPLVAVATPSSASSAAPWKAIASGGAHSCGISREGAVYCWGDDSLGQIGFPPPAAPTAPTFPQPTLVPSPVADHTFVAIAAGSNHTCAITTEGRVYCWGASAQGQLGDGTPLVADAPPYAPAPVMIAGPLASATITSIAAGGSTTCAIASGGAAYCWGDNALGQLGIGVAGEPARSPAPVTTPPGTKLTAVTVGNAHVCAIDSAAHGLCWGDNAFGQVGSGVQQRGGQGGQYLLPNLLDPLFTASQKVAAISAGESFTCAVTVAGSAWCWGQQVKGRLGNGYSGRNVRASVFTPTQVPETPSLKGRSLRAISAGAATACVLDAGGTAVCWGSNAAGQIGNDEAGIESGASPTVVQSGGIYTGKGLASISVGGSHVCAAEDKANGSGGVCWGSNSAGQLGQGSFAATSAARPRTVVAPAVASPTPAPAPTDSSGTPAPTAQSATPWGSIAGLGLALLILIGLVVWLLRRRRSGDQPDAQPAQKTAQIR